jgi:hypothetical protein
MAKGGALRSIRGTVLGFPFSQFVVWHEPSHASIF